MTSQQKLEVKENVFIDGLKRIISRRNYKKFIEMIISNKIRDYSSKVVSAFCRKQGEN